MNNPVIFARMPRPEVELVKKVSKDRGEDVSDFVRRAVYKELASLNFLSSDRKKALGMFTRVESKTPKADLKEEHPLASE